MTAGFGEGLIDDESPNEEWKVLSTTIFNTAVGVVGYSKRKNADRFDGNNYEIRKLLQERNAAYRAKLSKIMMQQAIGG